MRCSSCGLPLSPTRTQCPRCGTSAGSGKKEERSESNVGTPQQAFPDNTLPQAQEGQQGQGETPFTPQQPVNNGMPNQMAYAAPTLAQSFDQTNTPRSSVPDSLYKNDPAPPAQPGVIYPHLSGANHGNSSPQYPQPYPKLSSTRSSASSRVSLTVASLCVLTGGFILMLVYIISLSLPPVSVASQAPATNTPTQTIVPTQTPSSVPTPTQPTPTPTPTFPGQQFVDTVQMASNVNVSTAQPIQLTTNFRVGQQIFITFMLHPNNAGAVCLQWYINQVQFSQFAIQVGATPESVYSFAYAGKAGQGSVQVSWASSMACTDKMLARVATFTVS